MKTNLKNPRFRWMLILIAVLIAGTAFGVTTLIRAHIRTEQLLGADTQSTQGAKTAGVSSAAKNGENSSADPTEDPAAGTNTTTGSAADSKSVATPTPRATATPLPTDTPTPEPTLTPDETKNQQVEAKLSQMTTEEKVAQLFFITPDALTGITGQTEAGDSTRSAFNQIPVGGFVMFEGNVISPAQTIAMNQNLTNISMDRIGVKPFLGVDEEGGTVLRIADVAAFGISDVGNMSSIGATGNPGMASQVGATLGSYLSGFGFNLDFAPVADTLSNPENTVVSQRSFGSDPNLVSQMVSAEVQALQSCQISAVLKHFPGHGSTSADSHNGAAVSYRTMDELRTIDLLPFQAGISAGVDFVMAGHISLPNITSDGLPATLSYDILTGILRQEMGYDGIIITDAMNMGAIVNYYSSGQASIMAIQAGVDMILMPSDFASAYTAVVDAVNTGTITQERLNESVRRILRVKY